MAWFHDPIWKGALRGETVLDVLLVGSHVIDNVAGGGAGTGRRARIREHELAPCSRAPLNSPVACVALQVSEWKRELPE